jgi:hypothetical protein
MKFQTFMSYFDATLSSARLVGRIVEDFHIDTVSSKRNFTAHSKCP